MNSKKKGDLLEYIIAKELEREGYEVYQMENSSRQFDKGFGSGTVDVFSCDLIGLHRTKKNKFVQITSSTAPTERKRKLASHKWNLRYNDVLFIRFREVGGKKKFLCQKYDPFHITEWRTIEDIPIYQEMLPTIEEWRVRKNASMKAICDFLDLDYDSYKLWRKKHDLSVAENREQ